MACWSARAEPRRVVQHGGVGAGWVGERHRCAGRITGDACITELGDGDTNDVVGAGPWLKPLTWTSKLEVSASVNPSAASGVVVRLAETSSTRRSASIGMSSSVSGSRFSTPSSPESPEKRRPVPEKRRPVPENRIPVPENRRPVPAERYSTRSASSDMFDNRTATWLPGAYSLTSTSYRSMSPPAASAKYSTSASIGGGPGSAQGSNTVTSNESPVPSPISQLEHAAGRRWRRRRRYSPVGR